MIVCWLVLALPLLTLMVWIATLGVGFGVSLQVEGWIAILAFTGLLTLLVRWRMLGMASWPCAWLLYVAGFVVSLISAFAWYFQGSGFSMRFFANLRLDSLKTGLHAFPVLTGVVGLALLAALVVSAWLLWRVSKVTGTSGGRRYIRLAVLGVLVVVAIASPSPWQRLAGFFIHYRGGQAVAGALGPDAARLLASPDPVPRAVVRASIGKNLVIIYMESLERIYTDSRIFPGLTPNLNHWRAQGLDYAGYLTFTGADYTIAGLFSSQCGAPYLPSPVRALDLGGNNANATSFQPSLACLGDVLHAAGYRQVFMNGVSLSFADDGTFFKLHGFNQVLGLDQLEAAHDNKLPHPGWGLYDSDLFRFAVQKFDALAKSGKPFHLDVLTIDNHPPHGRPSPDCPKYAANSNDILQAVHCTDYLVGKFLGAISKNPAFKNTIVVVMSDHQSMRNDAWPLYPKWYKRRPLLFILNAGEGRRDMRFYHMDIAPTVLHLMNVKTNATFLAGADRSEANAPGNPLVNDAKDVSVVKHALWARAQPLMLCNAGVLVGSATNGVRIGGYAVPMSWRGRRRYGLIRDQAWLVRIGRHSVHGSVLQGSELKSALAVPPTAEVVEPRFPTGAQHYRTAAIYHHRSGESMLLIRPLENAGPMRQFSVDWIGRRGGITHLADVARLRGLRITSLKCLALLRRMDALPRGQTLDLSQAFKTTTAPLYPTLPAKLRFNGPYALPFEREFGWMNPKPWGTFGTGDYATLGFRLPKDRCHAMDFAFKVHPFIHASRPVLSVQVLANGRPMATWRFDKSDKARTWHMVTAPVRTSDAECRVNLKFVFRRPGALPPPYPKGVDSRPLQLLFLDMHSVSAPTKVARKPMVKGAGHRRVSLGLSER